MKVSVVIPTYDRPIELTRALKSAANQTYENIEIIVVNDSENDHPVFEIIEKLNDSRIKYYRNERSKGGNGARNTGILKATGNYIAFLDDDDEWFPKKLEKQMASMNVLDNKWGGCYCGYRVMLKENKWKDSLNKIEGKFVKELLTGKNSIGAISTLFIKKNVVEKIGLFSEKLRRYQDIYFVISFMRFYKLAFVNDILVKVYGHNQPKADVLLDSSKDFLSLISQDLKQLKKKERNLVFSLITYRISIRYLRERYYKNSFIYLMKSIRYRLLSPRKYGKYLFIFTCSIFGRNRANIDIIT